MMWVQKAPSLVAKVVRNTNKSVALKTSNSLYRQFLRITLLLARVRPQNGTFGLAEYWQVVSVGVSLVFTAIIFGLIYFVLVRPAAWMKKQIVGTLNRIRVPAPNT